MQRLCHKHPPVVVIAMAIIGLCSAQAVGDPPVNDYPTQARVEYVNECIATHGDSLSSLYQCSCVIDRIAERLSYDEFVEASTFARYSGLPGEGGGLFRDSDRAKKMGKLFRELEAEALNACGLKKQPAK
jgi:hypothetical protein